MDSHLNNNFPSGAYFKKDVLYTSSSSCASALSTHPAAQFSVCVRLMDKACPREVLDVSLGDGKERHLSGCKYLISIKEYENSFKHLAVLKTGMTFKSENYVVIQSKEEGFSQRTGTIINFDPVLEAKYLPWKGITVEWKDLCNFWPPTLNLWDIGTLKDMSKETTAPDLGSVALTTVGRKRNRPTHLSQYEDDDYAIEASHADRPAKATGEITNKRAGLRPNLSGGNEKAGW